ncbi:CRISPR-associated protein Cmr2 [bacterium]|nr:CRISPR-associated protein Cmr2 [bacterium]
MCKYTAISFAPVQGFIEKSRKLRDLYGASLILSYLSHCLIEKISGADKEYQLIQPNIDYSVLSTGDIQRGIPNRILFKGDIQRCTAKKYLRDAWSEVLDTCRYTVEREIQFPEGYHWNQEWIRWRDYTWEFFWGQGEDPQKANDDLETRKLKRDWTAINWTGESSSITGTDAIAWHRLGDPTIKAGYPLSKAEKQQQEEFYLKLAQFSENSEKPEGKFISPDERISIPELVKRLVNLQEIAEPLRMPSLGNLGENLKSLQRKPEQKNEKLIPGQWTGWFMGDGDKMGDYLKRIYAASKDEGLKEISEKLLSWGKRFKDKFPNIHSVSGVKQFGQVIYAGGDDFLGLIYSPDPCHPIPVRSVYDWLQTFPDEWNKHELPTIRDYPKPGKCQSPTVSVGFVWAAPSVPQRDVLQHCREAERRSKSLGRDRVTIRVVFNSGQYVQWTCPWDHLDILTKYRDRNDKTGNEANWTHLYNDWAHLKARHTIRLKDRPDRMDDHIALTLFKLYFRGESTSGDISQWEEETLQNNTKWIVGKDSEEEIIGWIDDLVNVGWHLCSNS